MFRLALLKACEMLAKAGTGGIKGRVFVVLYMYKDMTQMRRSVL